MVIELERLRDRPELKDAAAEWFHEKWGVPLEAYAESMEASLYLPGSTMLCMKLNVLRISTVGIGNTATEPVQRRLSDDWREDVVRMKFFP